MTVDTGRGVRVVKVEPEGEGHSYQRKDKALRAVLLQDGVADCLVAVVSIAGVFRGGKSFLLNIFLRYLHAKPSERADGSWLYAGATEALKGFSWRGGSEPNTSGLVLWSHPVHVTMPSGEQVAVVLMDTQGTFDCRSTVRDCSTIFALSTLLSSVQIYNLKENIKSDDFYHLQLFSEYGRLIRGDICDGARKERPFQVLQFLVRDWYYPYELEYGAEGGNALLQKRLQEGGVREQMMDCFERPSCFLMPHPGTKVATNPQFNGLLTDIDVEFKKCLLELVPSILDPANLQVKMINGEQMTGRSLYHYFKSYLDLFNSDDIPKPVTILEATTEAQLASGADATRAAYAQDMRQERRGEARAALRRRHELALRDALSAAAERPTLAGHDRRQRWLQQLEQELNEDYKNYEEINKAKVQKGILDAKRTYDEFIETVSNIEHICLHPQELEDLHNDAMDAAWPVFNCAVVDADEKSKLNQYFDDRFRQLQELNEKHNDGAVNAAHKAYNSYMEDKIGERPCVNDNVLSRLQPEAEKSALNIFHSKRNKPTSFLEDAFRSEVTEYTTNQWLRLQRINKANNTSAVEAAVAIYNEKMLSICGPHLPCLHPGDMVLEHRLAVDEAMELFQSKRTYGEEEENDPYIQSIQLVTGDHQMEFIEINTANNKTLVAETFVIYTVAMERSCTAEPWDPVKSTRILITFNELHERAKGAATDRFNQLRRPPLRLHNNDDHRNDLEQKIEARKAYYWNALIKHLCTVVGAAAAGVGLTASAAVTAFLLRNKIKIPLEVILEILKEAFKNLRS